MTENKKTLYDRVYEQIVNRRDRLLKGNINCIPWGFPRFEEENPGIEQGRYYLISANSKVGKTQIADWLFLYNTIQQVLENNLKIKLKIFYFSLEMTKEEKMLSAFANILYIKEGLRIAPKDLKSTKADRILSEDVLLIIEKYKPYFEKIEENKKLLEKVRQKWYINKCVPLVKWILRIPPKDQVQVRFLQGTFSKRGQQLSLFSHCPRFIFLFLFSSYKNNYTYHRNTSNAKNHIRF